MIGYSLQANRDTWHWVSGKTVSYIFWGEGQPNNYNREQNCAVLDSQLDWRWNDLSCKVKFYFVCNISSSERSCMCSWS